MWLIVENSPENISLLEKLGFILLKGAVEEPLLDIETVQLLTAGIRASAKSESEYVNPLPDNFLEQITLLESMGMKPEEIIGVLKG